MPQLDFTWWIINFFIVWITVFVILIVLVNNNTPQDLSQSSSLQINKGTTNWQWL
uniref:ATP synthase complex subunit 8 n=1 Tax=Sterechinus neumayeri TaxID=53479 RepID=A0A0F6MWX5_STENE|nr:ATP synthase F0 subunit 8 [Sterechinus neumayeri]AGU99586.1 ATP synthase F0 subunit 8 [Sterechinus neumayeri]AID60603.1 ATP synthase F0 subunit 8 [Sterechinus neumayeri]